MAQLTRLRGDGIPTRKFGGLPALNGTLSQTLSNLTVLAQATVSTGPTGTLSKTLGTLTASSTGKVSIEGIGQTAAITLAWDASIGAVGYRIYVGTTSGVYDYPSSPVDVGNVLIYRLENFPNDTYYFSVTAYNEAEEESGFSNELVDTIVAVDGLYFSSLELILSATGTVTTSGVIGTLNQPLSALTVSVQGNVSLSGSLTRTLDSLIFESSGTSQVVTTGTLSKTLDVLTASSAGNVANHGTASITLSALGLQSDGDVFVRGVVSETLDALICSSFGGGPIFGSLSRTLADLTCIAVQTSLPVETRRKMILGYTDRERVLVK